MVPSSNPSLASGRLRTTNRLDGTSVGVGLCWDGRFDEGAGDIGGRSLKRPSSDMDWRTANRCEPGPRGMNCWLRIGD